MKSISIIIALILSNVAFGQKSSHGKIKIKKDTINVCGEWECIGARMGNETSVDSFKLISTTLNENSRIVYAKSGQFLNKQEGDSMYYGTYKVDNINKILNWNQNQVNERNYKILYYNNKDMLLSWTFENYTVTYYFRRIKNCK
jgi:hypothetical protein